MGSRPLIKICGIRTVPFAVEAERLGADYVGLIFAKGSPRQVSVSCARQIVCALGGRAKPVGVFTDTPAEVCREIAREVGFGIVQLHRRATEDEVRELHRAGLEVWTLAGGAPGDAVLFDSSHGDGETTLRFGPWKTVLAGGISVENLGAALSSGADIIDASGSLETTPGVKSVAKLVDFMSQVKAAS